MHVVHVVTVPPRGSAPDLLWRRFAGIIGADHEGVDITRAPANASLGLVEVELLRRINLALPEDLPDWFYMRSVKDALASDALAKEPKPERLELPDDRLPWACEQSDRLADGLRAAGYDVIGDLADLTPRRPAGSRGPADLDDDELLRPALTVVTTLLTSMAADQGVPAAPPPAGPTPPRRSAQLIKRAAIATSRRSQTVHRLRRGYWHVTNAVRRGRSGLVTPEEFR